MTIVEGWLFICVKATSHLVRSEWMCGGASDIDNGEAITQKGWHKFHYGDNFNTHSHKHALSPEHHPQTAQPPTCTLCLCNRKLWFSISSHAVCVCVCGLFLLNRSLCADGLTQRHHPSVLRNSINIISLSIHICATAQPHFLRVCVCMCATPAQWCGWGWNIIDLNNTR